MAAIHRICRLAELQPGQPRGFELPGAGADAGILLIRSGQHVFGYMNSCPHTGVNLDWTPGRFLDVTGSLLQCSMHGALFRIEDGYCIFGPCAGRSLRPVALRVRGGVVEVDIPEGVMATGAVRA